MEPNWAAEHLQVIRTLMERAAVYRRALAPLMTFAGILGIAAASFGWFRKIDAAHDFVTYWAAVSIIVLTGTFFLVRRQAIGAGEPLWSPPTRRVFEALAPGFSLGAVAGCVVWARGGTALLPAIWVALYGCSLHAAGFFMPRGIRLFGWSFVLAGSLILLAGMRGTFPSPPHATMGFFFGFLHLAYGIYLYFTEQRRISL